MTFDTEDVRFRGESGRLRLGLRFPLMTQSRPGAPALLAAKPRSLLKTWTVPYYAGLGSFVPVGAYDQFDDPRCLVSTWSVPSINADR